MTTHTVADEVFNGAFAAMRDAYRLEPGNSTIREACHSQVRKELWGCVEKLLAGNMHVHIACTPSAIASQNVLNRQVTCKGPPSNADTHPESQSLAELEFQFQPNALINLTLPD